MSATSSLEIQVDSNPPIGGNGLVMVRLAGDAGVANVDALAQALLPITAAHPRLVIADLTRLSFISSLAMSKLLELHRGLKQRDGRLILAVADGDVRTALMRARLDGVLDCFSTVEEAIRQGAAS